MTWPGAGVKIAGLKNGMCSAGSVPGSCPVPVAAPVNRFDRAARCAPRSAEEQHPLREGWTWRAQTRRPACRWWLQCLRQRSVRLSAAPSRGFRVAASPPTPRDLCAIPTCASTHAPARAGAASRDGRNLRSAPARWASRPRWRSATVPIGPGGCGPAPLAVPAEKHWQRERMRRGRQRAVHRLRWHATGRALPAPVRVRPPGRGRPRLGLGISESDSCRLHGCHPHL